eukprot:CAMPEP_0203763502 /NCGR_PEP_ID=MMETSP0098-20131031/16329_1 /ASSEMBLY_ACC=CAM_ASM_000208 /TAXON_ID=96639 /ORGANISM=" , Strain NY0313808BC1" /LENGTH=321 /DNA_ID=CAMNT_0050658407 /DNA_START=367 /DNA_END=1332 /DNA_ORIENTATION=-
MAEFHEACASLCSQGVLCNEQENDVGKGNRILRCEDLEKTVFNVEDNWMEQLKVVCREDDQVMLMVNKYNSLRARKAGLDIRQKKINSNDQINKVRERKEEIKAKLAATKAENAKLQRDKDTNSHKVCTLNRRMIQLEEQEKDLEATRRVAEIEQSKRQDEETRKLEHEITALEAKCADFREKAKSFEEAKKQACEESPSLAHLTDLISKAEHQLESLQDETFSIENRTARIKDAMRTVLAHSAGDANADKDCKSKNMAQALQILVENGGEMHMADWKSEIGRKTTISSAKAIQYIYALVSASLVSIDRKQNPPIALAHVL